MAFAVLAAGLIDGSVALAAPPHHSQPVMLGAKPSRAETATARRVLCLAFGTEWSDDERTACHRIRFAVGHADFARGGRPDLRVSVGAFGFRYCGSAGWAGYAILATAQGHAAPAIDLVTFVATVTVLPSVHAGMHDLRFDDSHVVFEWDRARYQAR